MTNFNTMQRRKFLAKAVGLLPLSALGGAGLVGSSCSSLSLPSLPGFGGGGGAGLGGGSEWVGRRYFTRQTRFWGYVKRPGDPWSKSTLVIFNERLKHAPDRLPELAMEGRGHGFDHNFEYRLKGTFSGNKIYDPNSDKTLPEFVLRDYELVSEKPGHLFDRKESYSPYRLPPR